MAQQNDCQLQHLPANLFHLHLRVGPAWKIKYSMASEEEVQAFVRENRLTLAEEGAVGTWPMRVYRKGEQARKG